LWRGDENMTRLYLNVCVDLQFAWKTSRNISGGTDRLGERVRLNPEASFGFELGERHRVLSSEEVGTDPIHLSLSRSFLSRNEP